MRLNSLSPGVNAPQASYREKAELVHNLKRSVVNSPDALELRNRLRLADHGSNDRCYILPYDIILIENGFRHGLPGLFNPGYGCHESLRASCLKGLPPGPQAETAVLKKLHELATDSNAPIEIGGMDEKRHVWLEIRHASRPLLKVISSPVWGPVWCVKRLVDKYAPR